MSGEGWNAIGIAVTPPGRGCGVVVSGWSYWEATGVTALAAGTPSSQALVVEVIEEGGQQLSGRHQPGVEISGQLVRCVVALLRGDLAQDKVKVVGSHLAGGSWSRRL
jgi:hypothetical protein